MAFESFYGGRQGASFVIVKKFDGISIRENTVYKFRYFAKDAKDYFIVPLVERTAETFKNPQYAAWGAIPCDGVTTVISQDGQESTPLDVEYQEGMVQCFSKGGESVDVVNYGEYVIIDTNSKDDPDNGKVFRRGMDYTGALAGAEYIGQIVGPKGSAPGLLLTYLDDARFDGKSVYESSIDVTNNLVPGKDNNTFNDDIELRWTTIRDVLGNIENYLVGFQFPYLVIEMTAARRSSYKPDGTPIDENVELIDRIDDSTHPYYQKWKIQVPKGIKGNCIGEYYYFPTIVLKDSIVYETVDVETGDLSDPVVLAEDGEVDIDSYWNSKQKNYLKLVSNNNVYYAEIEEEDILKDSKFAEFHYGYLETNYDTNESGVSVWRDAGLYKNITGVDLANDGTLTVSYSAEDPDIFEKKIKWVSSVAIEKDAQDRTNLNVDFNTGESQNAGKINYVLRSTVAQNTRDLTIKNHLLVLYSYDNGGISYTTEDGFSSDKWTDLGYVKGDPGAFKILGNVTSETMLVDPPEVIGGDAKYEGWLMTVGSGQNDHDIYAYNYQTSNWYYIGNIDPDVDIGTIIVLSETQPAGLRIGGIWGLIENPPVN